MQEKISTTAYFRILKDLPFVKDVQVDPAGPRDPDDLRILIETPKRAVRFHVTIKQSNLTRSIAEIMISRMGPPGKRNWLVFAPYIGKNLARFLWDHGISSVDKGGNCRLRIDDDHIAVIEGQSELRTPPAERGLRIAGFQVIFALLAKPALLTGPLLPLANAAGVGISTTSNILLRLRRDGLVASAGQGGILAPGRLLEWWVHGYETAVRSKLVIGRYRAHDDNGETLEARVQDIFASGDKWGFGGSSAAHRLVGSPRGPVVTVHVSGDPKPVLGRLGAVEDRAGNLLVLGTPGPIGLEGPEPHVAHPLLVYSELLTQGDDPAREAARLIKDRFLS